MHFGIYSHILLALTATFASTVLAAPVLDPVSETQALERRGLGRPVIPKLDFSNIQSEEAPSAERIYIYDGDDDTSSDDEDNPSEEAEGPNTPKPLAESSLETDQDDNKPSEEAKVPDSPELPKLLAQRYVKTKKDTDSRRDLDDLVDNLSPEGQDNFREEVARLGRLRGL